MRYNLPSLIFELEAISKAINEHVMPHRNIRSRISLIKHVTIKPIIDWYLLMRNVKSGFPCGSRGHKNFFFFRDSQGSQTLYIFSFYFFLVKQLLSKLKDKRERRFSWIWSLSSLPTQINLLHVITVGLL